MKLELWGGVECTINRVGARYFDQMEKNGHTSRPQDLDLFAELGIRTLRFPVLWEKTQPIGRGAYDWAWTDQQLRRLQELSITPIAGLLHHGSGPHWTDLLDPDFARKFADYAFAVAQRYPWIAAYTPINEPLTTARFSGLYGHWFPHRRDDASFHKILLNEIEGTILAMEAIRSVQPQARLVQTEDLGKIFSTPLLQYQADFENERRWISFDLLSGRFDGRHPLWKFVTSTPGADVDQMERILARPCPPDIYGVNYYITSERFLDENIGAYPIETHGGNRFHSYADVSSVRIRPEGLIGSTELLRETHARYLSPVALTEVHLGCSRDEQLRWLMQAWQTGQRLNKEGVPVRAVTAWALLGAYNWNTLVTQESGTYEPGAFDVRRGSPRKTALATAIGALNATADYHHPVLDVPGWWRRPDRMSTRVHSLVAGAKHARPILVLGGRGGIGQALEHVCAARGLPLKLLSHMEADVCDPSSVRRAIERYGPWAVINASTFGGRDDLDFSAPQFFSVNVRGAANAAALCLAAGLPYVSFSSDLVFNGEKESSYIEDDETCPLAIYGKSKADAEHQILQAYAEALIIRIGPFFSPWHPFCKAAEVIGGDRKAVVPDAEVSPSYAPDFCEAMLDLLIDGERGIWHLANRGSISWRDFIAELGRAVGVPPPGLEIAALDQPALRPLQTALGSQRGDLMPSLESAISRFGADSTHPGPLVEVPLAERATAGAL